MFYTYILISKSGIRAYTGCTADINRRVKEHNKGKIKSSKPHRPFELLHLENFETLSLARTQERFYKTTSGRRKIKRFVEQWKSERNI